ncbi:MAG TPA: VWA domain-containing protein [Candidatus Coprenecus stercoravium]|uniref:VWA domain-containing protein n=1 Tax=Candidatus Coprenecus stercoravium TaxID=2840735 RepID=A0A9D2GPB0_9BACT|nr:VWA domain-containing protein [Candidatus Coprenecus stercoravium]
MNSLFFEYPWVLWLELVLVPMAAYYVWKQLRSRRPYVIVSTTAPLGGRDAGAAGVLRHLPFVLRMAAVSLLIVAIARPKTSSNLTRTDSEGIDIVLALDVSTSMLARDFTPDRIEAAKNIAIEFISQRPSDRIGVVVFAGESYTQSPLTTDRATLINLIKEIECGLIDDGTAIGNGLATAVARLKDSQAKSKVVILLTDGVNNRGEVTPLTAAEIASTYGIRVYTIGVGAMGTAPYPVMTPFGVREMDVKVEIDEDLLRQIAEQTGGSYFRATDNTKLMQIYGEINQMEKVRIKVDSFPVYSEEFGKFAVWALAAFLLEIILRILAARRIA